MSATTGSSTPGTTKSERGYEARVVIHKKGGIEVPDNPAFSRFRASTEHAALLAAMDFQERLQAFFKAQLLPYSVEVTGQAAALILET